MSRPAISRMTIPAILIAGLAISACDQPAPFKPQDKTLRSDRDAPFEPQKNYPEWAYDAPSYMKPVEELSPASSAREGDPPHYFTRDRLVQVRVPSNFPPEQIPRVAVWWTNDNGFHWQKAGYFGRAETFFPFEADEDGDYGIRFVGPGQPPASETPAPPERVYHVDTVLPEVEVAIDPDQSQYDAGQKVTISWQARDYHLIETPVSIQMLMDYSAEAPRVVELQRDLADVGSICYEILPEAADHQIRFRVEACDRAANLGLAFSPALQVIAPKPLTDSDAMTDAGPLPADSPTPDQDSIEPPAGQTATPAALTGSSTDEEALKPSGDSTDETDQKGSTSSDDEEETISAVDVGSTRGGPAGGPLPSAKPRPTSTDGRLTPKSGKPSVFPDGESPDGKRAESRLFDSSQTGQSAVKAATKLKEALIAAGVINSPPPTNPKRQAPQRFSMLPEDEDANDEALTLGTPDQKSELVEDAVDAEPTKDDAKAERRQQRDVAEKTLTPAKALSNLKHQIAAAIDVTHGNGLLVPMPATVEPEPAASDKVATIHPWRLLGEVLSAPVQAVWSLPRGRLGYELNRLLDGRFLANNPAMRAVAEPGSAASDVARAPRDADDADGEVSP
jgi:hypothetical protein